jgi:hypothetical protein
MEKYSRVSIIDASRHDAGTAYVASNRYQVDDRAPYVFRTRDYGKTWTQIVAGIAPGHFARAVREDPVRAGLLFLGTEHGVYVSFDAGDHWQSLQLNLPDTPIRDLVVKDADVVLGTHGRGFYVLDDIEPLRELRAETTEAALTLFKPGTAVRGVSSAVVQYQLKDAAEKVTVEILDESGTVIRTFTGTPEDEKKPKGEESFFGPPPPSPPAVRAGLNRFKWDLRYPGATTFEGIIIWGARPENGPKAPPGKYQVRVTAAGVTETRPIEVRIDPRIKGVTLADLKEQFDLASRIRDKTSAANEAVIRIRDIRKEVKERLERAKDRNLQATAETLLGKVAAVEEELYQVKNQSSQDPLNFAIRLNNRLAALQRSVETGDARPTQGAYKVFEELSAELAGHLEKLEGILSTDLAALNDELRRKKLAPIGAAPKRPTEEGS